MDKTFEPQAIERELYADWERRGFFAPSGTGTPYCIMIPPPNVTGTLHMGHAFQNSIMDALIRYHRMCGRDTLWQVGTDHAGIATQMVVERKLNAEGTSRRDLGREAFVERVWEWKAHSGGTIKTQLERLGASVDWTRERFTMDEGLSDAVTEVFVRLHEDGLIYRGKRLVNWDPVLHTALSDLEVVSEEEEGTLWHFRYPLADGDGHLVVATTRPETMLGDTAVAVHPEDERYSHLIGREVELPLTGRRIPVIADDYVDPEFGSGCVKITPAHDFNDNEIGARHGLDSINIFELDARLNANAPEKYQGLPRFEARALVVADLQALDLVDRIEPHRMVVPRGDRSHEVLEPLLTDQWFVRAEPLAKPAIEAVETGAIRFVPENWSKTYFEWMHNIQDWCISRQLWWGHRIPAWYGPDGEVYVGRNESEVREKAGLADDVALRQDEDVLDTWFSSALWPFSTLGWPERTPELDRYYPTSVLVTGFDIIFFWVARMIMMGLRFMGEVPFHEVYIHGLVRDAEGNKMSKAKGNILDPRDIIEGATLQELLEERTGSMMQPQLKAAIDKATRRQFPDGLPAFGTDALRFTFLAMATTGRDIRFDVSRIEGYRNFCNKLWNASRYVVMNTEGKDCGLSGECRETLADRWIRSRLRETVESVHEHAATYRFDLVAQAIYDFTWREFCDWYLELSKPVLQSGDADPALARGTRRTLVGVLEALLRILHPLTPFITEALWRRIAPLAGRDGESVMLESYPTADQLPADPEAEAEMGWVMAFLLGLRQIRGEMDIAPARRLDLLLQDASPRDLARVEQHRTYLEALGRVGDITAVPAGEQPPACATALLGEMKILVPLAGLIDLDAEIARLTRRRDKMQGELTGVERKLDNANFVSKAPAAVVEEQKRRATELSGSVTRLDQQLAGLRSAQDQD